MYNIYPSMSEWIKNFFDTYTHIYTVEYYSAIKNRIFQFTITWMDVKGIMLSKIGQQRKTNTI